MKFSPYPKMFTELNIIKSVYNYIRMSYNMNKIYRIKIKKNKFIKSRLSQILILCVSEKRAGWIKIEDDMLLNDLDIYIERSLFKNIDRVNLDMSNDDLYTIIQTDLCIMSNSVRYDLKNGVLN